MAYQPIPSESKERYSTDKESLLSFEDEYVRQPQKPAWKRPSTIISITSIFLNLIAAIYYFLPHGQKNLNNLCGTYTSEHASPVTDATEIPYVTTHLNGSFTNMSPFREPASPATDAVWHNLISLHVAHLAVPVSKAERYGLHPWQVKLANSTPGLEHATEPHLVADLEVFHQLHCLDMLRRGSHWDYPYYRAQDFERANQGKTAAFSGSDESSRLHFSHCVDMLRQRLMCTSDLEIAGQVWLGNGKPFLMFGGERKCRDFEKIKEWFNENKVRADADGKVLVEKIGDERIFDTVDDIPL